MIQAANDSPPGGDNQPAIALPTQEAKQLISTGKAPAGLTVRGELKWKKPPQTLRLPEGLTCYQLDLQEFPITDLPADLTVQFKINLRDCKQLESLPPGLKAGSLDVSGCTSLAALPEDLDVYFLDISDCPQLRNWPQSGSLNVGRLRAHRCTGLTYLPPWIKRLSQLDIRDCANLNSLPDGLEVSSWIDLAGTGITELPASLSGAPLRWRGVPVDERIAFRPEEITAEEVLDEPNAELRRVMLERMGFEKFLAEADAEVLDTDQDAGGERRLLRVPLGEDEPLVCVSVFCPSTDRQYIIRVPPHMRTCHQAIAWTAGFDNPDDYQPIVET